MKVLISVFCFTSLVLASDFALNDGRATIAVLDMFVAIPPAAN
jgi:hypothetical protein